MTQKLQNSNLTNNIYNIKNSYDLVKKCYLNENPFITSYDRTNTFTEMSVEETINIIIDKFKIK